MGEIVVPFAMEAVEIAEKAVVVDWCRVQRFDPSLNRFWAECLLPVEKASLCLYPPLSFLQSD